MNRHHISFSSHSPSVKLAWCTDLHLDAAKPEQQAKLIHEIIAEKPDALLVGGDIVNGYRSLHVVEGIQDYINRPLYYVLGNHDFYHGSIAEIRTVASRHDGNGSTPYYLTGAEPKTLAEGVVLIGHDGWADASEGDFLNSTIELNDYRLIQELKNISPEERMRRLQGLGSEAAQAVKVKLCRALKKASHVILLTHTPPFREACRYPGKEQADEVWLPHFVCKAMGAVIMKLMQENEEKKLLILCGHSHAPCDFEPAPNIRCITGGSTLGKPEIRGVITL